MTCPRCGTQNPANSRFCMKCGADMTAAAPASTEASGAGTAATGTGGAYSYTSGTATADPPPGAQAGYTAVPGAGYSAGAGGTGYSTPPGAGGYTAPPQFAPSPSSYGAGMGVANQGQLAGFGVRLVAYIIDLILINIVSAILNAIHLGALGTIVNIGYFVYFWSTTGQTVGMMPFHIKVVREDGQPLSWGTGVLRFVGYIISIIPIFLGLLWAAWDPRKQGWHDKIAHTLVVQAP